MLNALFSSKTDIAINAMMPTHEAHGILWTRPIHIDENDTSVYAESARMGGVNATPFRAAKPKVLEKVKRSTLLDIQRQLADMGLVAKTLEVMVGSELKVYAFN